MHSRKEVEFNAVWEKHFEHLFFVSCHIFEDFLTFSFCYCHLAQMVGLLGESVIFTAATTLNNLHFFHKSTYLFHIVFFYYFLFIYLFS